jgi:hypothetical protein
MKGMATPLNGVDGLLFEHFLAANHTFFVFRKICHNSAVTDLEIVIGFRNFLRFKFYMDKPIVKRN